MGKINLKNPQILNSGTSVERGGYSVSKEEDNVNMYSPDPHHAVNSMESPKVGDSIDEAYFGQHPQKIIESIDSEVDRFLAKERANLVI